MKIEMVFTKKKMRIATVFMTDDDHRRWLAAASVAGLSRSELLRRALRGMIDEILSRATADSNGK
jgi:hypothetical protein